MRQGYAVKGIDAQVSWQPPLIDQGYEPLLLACPHGVPWYAWPTDEQRQRWAEEGVQ